MFEFVTKSFCTGFGKGCETELGKVRSYRKQTASHNTSIWNSEAGLISNNKKYFHGVCLGIPVKNCIVGMTLHALIVIA